MTSGAFIFSNISSVEDMSVKFHQSSPSTFQHSFSVSACYNTIFCFFLRLSATCEIIQNTASQVQQLPVRLPSLALLIPARLRGSLSSAWQRPASQLEPTTMFLGRRHYMRWPPSGCRSLQLFSWQLWTGSTLMSCPQARSKTQVCTEVKTEAKWRD